MTLGTVRVGGVSVDVTTGDVVRADGTTCRLQHQPLQIFRCLVEQPGQVVGRDTLARAVWAEGVHVDFEHGLNYAVRQVRAALGDVAGEARFIETLPRKGYRLVPSVEWVAATSLRRVVPNAVEPAGSLPLAGYVAFGSLALLVAAGVVSLTGGGSPGLARPVRTSAEASSLPAADWHRYGRALHHLQRGLAGDTVAAREILTDLASRYPLQADVQAALADGWLQTAISGDDPPSAAFDAAERAARRALVTDAEHGPALAVLATITYRRDWRWQDARHLFERALSARPDAPAVLLQTAWFEVAIGDRSKAVVLLRRAVTADPTSPRTNSEAAWLLTRARRFNDAIEQAERVLALEPSATAMRFCLECAYTHTGRFAEAMREVRATALPSTDWSGLPTDPREGLRRIDRWRLDELLRAPRVSSPYVVAVQAAAAGDGALALWWLARARDQHDPGLALVLADPVWDSFHADAQFGAVLTSMGLPRVSPGTPTDVQRAPR